MFISLHRRYMTCIYNNVIYTTCILQAIYVFTVHTISDSLSGSRPHLPRKYSPRGIDNLT